MAKLILEQAQICEDDFHQQFRPATAFFSIDDFAAGIRDERDNLLDTEFQIQINKNKGVFPEVNPNWLSREVVDVKRDEQGKWYADVCTPLYEFPQDERGMGIQDIDPFGGGCAEFVRITNHQAWQICLLPPTHQNFYSVEKCRIWLYNFFNCTPKLEVTIVASQSGLPLDKQTVPDGKAATIREVVLNKFFRNYQVKLGKIKTINDGNPNPQPNETGLTYDALKTK